MEASSNDRVDSTRPPSSADLWTAAILCVVTLTGSCLYFLPSPYFLDSFGYVEWIGAWNRTGEIPSKYRLANTLLYYFPITLFGEFGLKVVGVGSTTALAGAYYFMVRRDFSSVAALASAILFFSAPPTVITATHLKEDLTSLLFFTVCVLLIRTGAGTLRMLAAGVAYGLALLFKEIMLGAAPFVLAYIHLRGENLQRYRDCVDWRILKPSALRVVALAIGTATAILIVSPTRFSDYATMASSPHMGQFYGLFSAQQPHGLRFWAEALLYLHPWYLIPISVFLATLGDRSPTQALYLIMAVVLLLFLSNVSVVRMRHFAPVVFFLAPVLFEGIRSALDLASEVLQRRGWPPALSATASLLVCAAIGITHLAYVFPTIDYRLRYDISRGFYAPLAQTLPGNALLLGMDNCPIARYESRLPCENHSPDLDAEAAQRYAAEIARRSIRRPVYLLPDFFDYDRAGHVKRAFQASFATEVVHSGWWEPYHAMTYGISIDDAIAQRLESNPGCVIEGRDSTPVPISDDLVLDDVELRFRCDDGQKRRTTMHAHRNHRTYLVERAVSALEAR